MKHIELPHPQIDRDSTTAEKLFKNYSTCDELLKEYKKRAPVSVFL
jgi:hypothetical protein